MARAVHIRQQLEGICALEANKSGLGMDVSLSCGKNGEAFFHALFFVEDDDRILVLSRSFIRRETKPVQHSEAGDIWCIHYVEQDVVALSFFPCYGRRERSAV